MQGRGHESDVRVFDISISRVHAVIRKVNNDFYLNDYNSKFGTLVLSKQPLPIRKAHPLLIQTGRTVLRLSLQQPLCSCCYP